MRRFTSELHRKPLLIVAAIVAVVSVVVFLISGPFTTEEDIVGGREAGIWFADNTPSNATFLAMGPSLGNLVSSYGNRGFFFLSGSEDPTSRDSADLPIPNPGNAIRQMHVQYAVWDAYTAGQVPFFSQRLMFYVEKYSGTPVFSVWVDGNKVETASGPPPPGAQVHLVVYQLVGGDPLRDRHESSG